MVEIFFANIFYAKVFHDKGKGDVSCFVLPESWCAIAGYVSILSKVFF